MHERHEYVADEIRTIRGVILNADSRKQSDQSKMSEHDSHGTQTVSRRLTGGVCEHAVVSKKNQKKNEQIT
jgi:hypothetical protein